RPARLACGRCRKRLRYLSVETTVKGVIMGCTRNRAGLGLALLLTGALAPMPLRAQDVVMEATIAELHESMLGGRLTATQLVQQYLDRIAAYDKSGPALNAI